MHHVSLSLNILSLITSRPVKMRLYGEVKRRAAFTETCNILWVFVKPSALVYFFNVTIISYVPTIQLWSCYLKTVSMSATMVNLNHGKINLQRETLVSGNTMSPITNYYYSRAPLNKLIIFIITWQTIHWQHYLSHYLYQVSYKMTWSEIEPVWSG